MKRLAIVLIGLSPILVGLVQSYLRTNVTFFSSDISYQLVGFLVFAIWFIVGRYYNKLAGSKANTVLLINTPAFLVLVLLLIQEAVLGDIWTNIVGQLTQLFYTPMLFWLVGVPAEVIREVMTASSMLSYMIIRYITSFICLLLASYVGCVFGDRRG